MDTRRRDRVGLDGARLYDLRYFAAARPLQPVSRSAPSAISCATTTPRRRWTFSSLDVLINPRETKLAFDAKAPGL